MPARREHTHGHLRSPIAQGSRASALARLAGAAVRWAALGLVLVASFWVYLGAVELIGGEEAIVSTSEVPEARGAGCTALTLDRPSGRTSAGPCHGPALMLRETLAARLPEPSAR
jgi:hypothetical protein